LANADIASWPLSDFERCRTWHTQPVNPPRAVLSDWRGTLAPCPPPAWWAERAFGSIDRPVTVPALAAAALEVAGDLAEIDSSAGLHREATLGVRPAWARCRAGAALYALDADPANHLLYPDNGPVLREIHARGVGSPSSATFTSTCVRCTR
jgi:hypothetical protein